jgi:hypothetical protein
MSWWTTARDDFEAVFTPFAESDSGRNKTTGIAGGANKIYSDIGGGVNKILGRQSEDEKRNQMYAVNDQIKAYKDQTALEQKELATAQAEKEVAKRQVNEKQVRLLRNNYRSSSAAGFLNNQGGGGSLGDQSGVSSKLGS